MRKGRYPDRVGTNHMRVSQSFVVPLERMKRNAIGEGLDVSLVDITDGLGREMERNFEEYEKIIRKALFTKGFG